MAAAKTDRALHTPRPVLESDVQDAINDHAQFLAASGNPARKIRLDFVLTNGYVTESDLEQVVSDAINEFIMESVAAAYEEANDEISRYFE